MRGTAVTCAKAVPWDLPAAWVVVPQRAAQCPTLLQLKGTDQRPFTFLKGISVFQKCEWCCEAETHPDL